MLLPEISNVTWSSQGIAIEYSDSTVATMSAEDIYPLAVPVKRGSLVAFESKSTPAEKRRRSM